MKFLVIPSPRRGGKKALKLPKEPLSRISKEWCLGDRVSVTFDWRSSKSAWGRFGGGWNWKIGVQASRSSVIIALLVFSIGFQFHPKMKG